MAGTGVAGPRGWWECVSVIGAVAASTTTIGVGSWVLSALHRNPGLTVKAAETLDEISDGRFVLGLGRDTPATKAQASATPMTRQCHATTRHLRSSSPHCAAKR